MSTKLRQSPKAPLRDLHTFGLQARSIDVATFNHLDALTQYLEREHEHTLILGEGSNVAFTEDYMGQVLLNRMKSRSILSQSAQSVDIVLGAGENWHESVMWSLASGFHGLENLVFIPGTVGAAPFQNIGAYGRELSDFFVQLEAFDRERQKVQIFSRAACDFGYRDSLFKRHPHRYVILSVQLRLAMHPVPLLSYGQLEGLVKERFGENFQSSDIATVITQMRQSKLPDPKKIGNAGSFFKNPTVKINVAHHLLDQYPNCPIFPTADNSLRKLSAAWLIDQCGLKGHRSGGAQVFDQQPLVLVNIQEATGEDLLQLARFIKRKVFDRFGVTLENEVQLMGAHGRIAI